MKNLSVLLLIFLCSCGGKLSDEQRKKLREGMKEQKILKVTESEIMTAALDQGKQIYNLMEQSLFDSLRVDSLEKSYQVKIRWITPANANAQAIEGQLIEAYVLGMATGALQDNIQKLRSTQADEYDSLLYSKPIVTKMPDGADKLEGVWNIYLAKKQVVLSIN